MASARSDTITERKRSSCGIVWGEPSAGERRVKAAASGLERTDPLDAAAIDEADTIVRVHRQEPLGESIEEVEQAGTLVRQLHADEPRAHDVAEEGQLHVGVAHAGAD